MIVPMKTPLARKHPWSIAFLLLAVVGAANAQNIYKCTHGGRVEYTDHPCPGDHGVLIHQADEREIIDHYFDLGQDAVAKRYADSHHLQALYQERLHAYYRKMQARTRQQVADAVAAKQREEAARQQALVDAAANRGRLQGENDALRQQIDQYRSQQAQPAYNEAPAYWGGASPYLNPGYDRDYGHGHEHHDHDQPDPPFKPIFHPCTQLAGGRVQC